MQRPSASTLQGQDGQHHRQQQHHSYQGQQNQHQQYPTSSFPGSFDIQQQQSMSSFGQGGMMNGSAAMPNGFGGMNDHSGADFSAFLSNYQPLTTDTGFNNGIPNTAQLGLAPTMGSAESMPQLDPATAAAAAAAYGTLGRSTIANVGDHGEAGNPYASFQGNDAGSSFPPASQRGDQSVGPRLASQSRGSLQQQMGAAKGRRNDSSATQPSHMNMGMGYEGDGSNSASTQTPAPSSSGEDQDALRVSHVGGGNNGILPPHLLSDQIRSSSSASTSSASMFGQQFGGHSQQNFQPHQHNNPPVGGNRTRRAQSGSFGTAASNAQDASAPSAKRLSGPAITTSGTTNNPRSSQHPANPSIHQSIGRSMAAGHAASHPPGTGSQILRGIDNHASGSNAASDFTRRKGWHTRIVDELLDFVHILDKEGKVLFAASSVGAITGWKPEELVGHNICDFIHPDDSKDFMKGFETSYKDRSEMLQYYRFRKKPQTAADKQKVRDQVAATEVNRSGSVSEGDSSNQDSGARLPSPKFTDTAQNNSAANVDDDEGELVDDSVEKYVVMEVSGHPYFWTEGLDQETAAEAAADFAKGLVTSPKTDSPASPKDDEKKTKAPESEQQAAADGDDTRKQVQCFFCSGRVYPTKNIGMLDSFLELKLENERLRTLLGELSLNDGSTEHTGGSSDGRRSLEEVGYHPDYAIFDGSHPNAPPGRMGNVSFDLMDGNAKHEVLPDGSIRRQSAQSIAGQQSSPTSPRTLGIDRGVPGADTTQGEDDESNDGGSPTLGDDDSANRHKKKKTKQEEGDFVCTDCGRVDSPEWRKGPLGPKTLCNACGLRWAKKVKRSGGDPNALTGKGLQAQGGAKVQQPPFSDFSGNPFVDEAHHTSMSAEPQGGQISGAPGYAMLSGGQPDMGMMNHHAPQNSFPPQQYTPHQHYSHPDQHIPPPMQHHNSHHQHQSMLGAVQSLYDQGSSFAHSHSPQQHNLVGGQPMPPTMPHDLVGAGGNFIGQDASMSSVLMNPHRRPQAHQQPSHGAAPNMMNHMYGGGAA